MSFLRVLVCCLAVFGWAGEAATTVLAQSEKQPIYLYTGQAEQKDDTWTDRPEKAIVHVFREPVPEGKEGGRRLGNTIAEANKSLLDQTENYQDTTTLEKRSYPGKTYENVLATSAAYPSEDVRYFLLIEIGKKLYASRTLGSAFGNIPRYHTLNGENTVVRVEEVHDQLQSAVERLVRRVEQSNPNAGATNGQNTGEDSSGAGTFVSKPKVGSAGSTEAVGPPPEKHSSPTPKKSSESAGSSSWMSLIGRVLSWSALWWGTGSGLFGILMFFVGMSVGGSSRKSSSNKGNSMGRNWEDHPVNQGSRLSGDSDAEEADSELEEKIEALVEERVEQRVQKIEDQLQEVRENVLKLYKKQVEPLQNRVVKLENKLKEEQKPEETQASGASEELDSSDKVGNAFVKWCRKGGSSVRRIGRFRSFINEEIQAEEVREIQYEKDAASDEFVDDARNGITFWLVRKGAHQYVLPNPLNNSQFDKLEPVFEGRAQPDTIEGIQPARLARQAGRLVLEGSGKIW